MPENNNLSETTAQEGECLTQTIAKELTKKYCTASEAAFDATRIRQDAVKILRKHVTDISSTLISKWDRKYGWDQIF